LQGPLGCYPPASPGPGLPRSHPLEHIRIVNEPELVTSPDGLVYSTHPRTALGVDGHLYYLKAPQRLRCAARNSARRTLTALKIAAPSSNAAEAGTGPAIRTASVASLSDTAASSSPATTDIAVAMAWWDSLEKSPATVPTSRAAEETAPAQRRPRCRRRLMPCGAFAMRSCLPNPGVISTPSRLRPGSSTANAPRARPTR
jgi:hypothetical protein